MHGEAPGGRIAPFFPWHSTNITYSSENTLQFPHHDAQRDIPDDPVGYEQVAQDIRTALRDDDVEMEDTSDWPTSWVDDDDEQEVPSSNGRTLVQSSALRLPAQSSASSENGSPRTLYIVLDTNIFISHLKAVQAIHEQLLLPIKGHHDQTFSKPSQRSRIKLLVPNIVVHGG